MISVSIVTYHTATDELEKCLACLDTPLVDRITIVDNGSEERLRQFCLGRPKVEYLALPNPGFGAAHNRALLTSTSPYHLVLNSDVVFSPSVLATLVECLERNPQVAQIQPKIMKPDGSMQHGSRRVPGPLILIGRRFLPDCFTARANRRYLLMDEDDGHTPLCVPYQVGCFMLLRTSAARAIGGFDERFFMYPEDIDLSRRMRRHHVVLYYPQVTVVHAHAAASYSSGRMLRIHVFNMLKYFRKWGFVFDSERRALNRSITPVDLN